MAAWTVSDIPDQTGRVAVVTGSNGGVGYPVAREFARRGAHVVLACRSERRGTEACARLRAEVPAAEVEFRPLDLAELASVRDFAHGFAADRLDLLVNNAGVMALPYRETADGFEMQMGVNHFGHFALTGLLLPKLLATPGARVVSVSSIAHLAARVDPADLGSRSDYRPFRAYARTKSANLLFVHELARRLAASGSDVVAAAAHPGYAATNLQLVGPRMEGRRLAERLNLLGYRAFAQSADQGALPVLFAATAPEVRPDAFIGTRLQGWRGGPARSWRARWTLDDAASEGLWEHSVKLTGVAYEALAP